MEEYQERYAANLREISSLMAFYGENMPSFAQWLQERQEAKERIALLRRENLSLLGENLFPTLDRLHEASPETLAALQDFAAVLMDWRTNLDVGIYLVIHEALLSLARVRRERENLVKECYMVGMGHYYQNRMVDGISGETVTTLLFQGEMAFTEAASYFHYIEELSTQKAKGYVLRALANVAIATKNPKKKIAASSRMLTILDDERIRALAPDLPWAVFRRKTHQQMSANRGVLSRDDLTQEEMAWVLDSCCEVFRPEEGNASPSNRWLWPYYEMQYTCGYVDLETTLLRLERLIADTPEDDYGESGMYGRVQLPIYYGILMKKNPQMQSRKKCINALAEGYRRMRRALLSCPPERFDDFFFYLVNLVFSDFYEADVPGAMTYRELTTLLMKRLCGELYVKSRRAGDMMQAFAAFLEEADPSFFADLPLPGEGERREELLRFARECGLYHDFGLIQMNIERLQNSRSLFEGEFEIYKLHTLSASQNLRKRPSTRRFADVALGHHAWYGPARGYPAAYERNASPYRLMTDVMAVVSFLLEDPEREIHEAAKEIQAGEGTRFSPLVTVYLTEEDLLERLDEIRRGSGEEYYREIYEGLMEET